MVRLLVRGRGVGAIGDGSDLRGTAGDVGGRTLMRISESLRISSSSSSSTVTRGGGRFEGEVAALLVLPEADESGRSGLANLLPEISESLPNEFDA